MKDNGETSFAVWITGLPASGKSALTAALVRQLGERGTEVEVLESDALRKVFSGSSTYDEQDREYFYGAIAFVGEVFTRRGIPVIFDATANRRSYRDRARQRIARFIEVYVECPLEVCVQRDPKGIYRKARQDESNGESNHVPGFGAVYEPPETPDVVIRGDREDPDQGVCRVVDLLVSKGWL